METGKVFWIHNPVFDDPSVTSVILGEMPGESDYVSSIKSLSNKDFRDAPDVLPLLTQEQEQHLFRKMNFLKCCATRPDAVPGDLEQAGLIRERLIRANLRLLFRMIKLQGLLAAAREDLISDGEMALWRAVEKFDYDRGCRFSTFATPVIRRRIGQRVETALKESGVVQFVADYPEDGRPTGAMGTAGPQGLHGSELEPFLVTLSPREEQVVRLRHGLGEAGTLSLVEVGIELGVSKTRIRQLEQQAYAKLRRFAELAAC